MASSSTSHCSPQLKHDVFLSFRGEDTREGFVSHLHAALSQKKIETFIDYGLIRGNEISTSLLNAIEGSKISVVIFSENYASSGWCLDELVKILECKEKYGRFVIPVFYRIDPSHVRKQTGIFADAFTKHEKERVEKVQNWRKALTDAANLSGFDSHAIRPESALTNNIIEDIIKKLNDISPVDNKDLVGIDSSTDSIVELLESGNTRKIGIWGIGGIGKATLAHAIFDKISRHFEGSCFVEDVKKALEKNDELIQQKLLATLFEDECPNIKLEFTKERLSRKKVLIVFDDVTCVTQVEKLIGNVECLDSRSRIIITSRDKQVLESCGVNYAHMVSGLWDYDALQLFSRYALDKIIH